MDVWEALYQVAVKMPESNPTRKNKHFRYKNYTKQKYTSLRGVLDENELNTLEHIMEHQEKFLKNETRGFFIKGFKLGMSFAIESLNP